MELVELEGVKSLGYDAFGEVDCKELDLGEGLESIGNGCFYCNEALTNVFIPKSCTYIDDRAFIGCDKLTDVCIANPSCVIHEYAFDKDYLKAIFGFVGSTAETYADQKGIQFVPVGNLGTGTIDLSDGSASIQDGDPVSSDYPIMASLDALVRGDMIGILHEGAIGYMDLDKDGTRDVSYDMDEKKVLMLSVLPKRSVGGAIRFTLPDEAIENIFGTSVAPYYETLVFKLPKLANPMTVNPKSATVKYSKLKKKTQAVAASKAFSLNMLSRDVSFKKTSGNSKIKVSSSGKITVKKGLKKGTYKVKVKVTSKGNKYFNAGSKTVTVKVKVK
jgi:hypothetical protein